MLVRWRVVGYGIPAIVLWLMIFKLFRDEYPPSRERQKVKI